MSFLDDIKNRNSNLRKVQTKVVDFALNNDIICKDESDYEKLLKEVSFESYYDAIKEFTFHSVTFPIKMSVIKSLVEEGNKYLEYKRTGNSEEYTQWRSNEELLSFCKEINQKRDDERRRSNRRDTGVFVRLSTISPKDAVVNRTSFKHLVDSRLQDVDMLEKKLNISFLSDMNRRLYALYIASTEALEINDGSEAVQLLIESGRTQQELNTAVRTNQEIHCIVREFSKFDVAHEFRCYINNEKLSAISQYNHMLYFPHLAIQKNKISEAISNFFEQNILHSSKIKMKRYVADVILVQENDLSDTCQLDFDRPFDVKIIEINPLAEFAGSCMFTWENDRDQLTGKLPLEFRIVESLPHAAEEMVGPEWRPLLEHQKPQQ
ncbi:translation initiation regulator CDC123 [Acrasis kona]|uniref:Translation initiation regulator CDC123 n=1 Tax=Acrasis kona TaxID=1008807 RepID=A0AAW2YIU3_9EUKA